MNEGETAEHLNNIIKTRYTIHKLIKNKKQLSYTFASVILFIFALVSSGISIYIHNYYGRIQYDLVSFGHYSKIAFETVNSFLSINNDLIGFQVLMAQSFLPPFSTAEEYRSVIMSQIDYGTNKTKDMISQLRKDNSMSQEVWLSTWTLFESTKLEKNGQQISMDRSMQDSISLLLQAYNLERKFSSLSQQASTQYDQQLKASIVLQLRKEMLDPLFNVYQAEIEPKLDQMLATFSGQETNSYTAVIICMGLFSLLYFIAILLIDIEFTKKLDKLVRLFYGFRTQDCRELIKRCERLMDKIQASQFNNDEELLAVNDVDQDREVKHTREGDYVEVGSRRRKGKGSLIKIVSLRMGLVLFFLIGNFFLKFYSLETHRMALEDLSIVYDTGMNLDKFQTHLTASSVWLVKSCLQPNGTLNQTKSIISKAANLWSDLQLVSFLLPFAIDSYCRI